MRALLLALLLPLAATAQPRHELVLDPWVSAEAGGEALLSVRAGLGVLEDAVLPLRLGPEDTAGGKALGVGYRLGRLALVTEPAAWFTVVLQHEVFGHGARTREFGWEQTGYRLQAPFPYGAGGGSASFRAPEGFTPDERGAFSLSGSHASTVLADLVAEDAVQRGRIGVRDAILYPIAALDAAHYVIRKGESGQAAGARNDVVAWRSHLDARAAARGLDARVTLGEAQRAAASALLDPMLYITVYGLAKGYLWDGASDLPVPMLRIGEVGYLPAVRFSLGPHGGEVMLDHRLARGDQTALVRMRVAAPAIEPAWGLGLSGTSLVTLGAATIDAGVDVWNQPALRLDPRRPHRESGGGLGGAVRATARAPVALGGRLGALVQLGAKTPGFVGAERLDGGPLVRVGLSLQEGR